jgi:peptidyl-prolyl cis-trans isomerase A (cyclophilin A)
MSTCIRVWLTASLCFSFAIGAAAQAPAAAPAGKGSLDPALLEPGNLRATAPAEYDAKFVTTAGEFTIKVTRAWSPNGADRFYNLVSHHFFDGAAFFRVLSGFMAQFGISAYPEVSQVWQKAVIRDDPHVQSNKRGYVTFATAGPNTRTTQVFINFGNNAGLDSQGFTPFGVISEEGMKVVDKLYSGYGEGAPSGRGPDQQAIQQSGRAYLEKGFPKLDTVRTATIVSAANANK